MSTRVRLLTSKTLSFAAIDRPHIGMSGVNQEVLTLFFGLLSAATWGAADFSGGLAARKANLYAVVLVSQVAGGAFLAGLALLFGEALPPATDLLFGALAGLAGMLGLLGLYSGLSRGRMGVVAPLTAVLAAVLPVFFSLVTEGLPPLIQVTGFGLTLVAVWLLSGASGGRAAIPAAEVGYALLAGTGFALFFILIDQANEAAVFWPLVAARLASVTCLALFVGLRGNWQRPPSRPVLIILLAGLLDALGNAFFVLAARYGRLDLAAILASLYPAATVLLAQLILRERLGRWQWAGILIALIALVLIAAPL